MVKEIFGKIKKHFLLSLVIVFGIVLVIFLIAFNTSDKRYGRAMNKAEKAYAAQDFEKAVGQYEKAINIKQEFVAPYLGLLCAKEAMGAEDIADTYEAGLEAIGEMEDDSRYVMQDQVIEYVLHESEVYGDDIEARIEALDKGYEDTAGAEDISRILTECLSEEVEELRASDSYEEAIELAERFADKAEYDSEELLTTLQDEKEFSEAKLALLAKVEKALGTFAEEYKAANKESNKEDEKETEDVSKNDISANNDDKKDVSENETEETVAVFNPLDYDFSEMFAIDASKEATDIAFSFVSDSYIHINDDGKNGTGLYTFADKYRTENAGVAIPYYFYFGEYEGTVKSGFGVTFTSTGENSYIIYAGQWADDKPNGEGTKYIVDKGSEENPGFTRVYSGNWKDGNADGVITVKATDSNFEGISFRGEVKAKEGVCETVPTESEEYVVLNLRTENLIAVLPSDSEGYALMLTIWKKEGELLKALENK